MKKSTKYITILLLFFLFIITNITSVKADVACSTINNTVNAYNSAKDEYSKLDCTKTEDNEVVKQCNNAETKKALYLSRIFKYNDMKTKCDKTQVSQIVNENKDSCSNVYGSSLRTFTSDILKLFYIIAPFLLIIFGSLDFSKVVVMTDISEITTARRNFFRRFIALILLYLIPLILNIFFNLDEDLNLNNNVYSCKTSYVHQLDKWDLSYSPNSKDDEDDEENGSRSGGGSSKTKIGGIKTAAEATKEEKIINEKLLHTKRHGGIGRTDGGKYQNGKKKKYWKAPYNVLSPFQCTWWANGRASQYLEEHGTKYKKYPTQLGNGGEYYSINKKNGWFKYGSSPRPNSIISWTHGAYGHVAYVEGVAKDGIYISQAGSGTSWFGITKIPLDGSQWASSGYKLNGYIYLDQPIEK